MKFRLILVCWIASQMFVLVACDSRQNTLGQVTAPINADQLWNFLVIDEGSNSRVRKWSASRVDTLLVLDQDHMAMLAPQLLQLVSEFSERSPVRIGLCIESLPSGPEVGEQSCPLDHFDSYILITNGHWNDAQWRVASNSMAPWAAGRLGELVKQVGANRALEKGTCQFILRPSTEQAFDISGAVAVADFSDRKILGPCFINLFLGSLGVSPFDGRGQIDVRTEADSYSDFLLKEAPNGGLYLTNTLYRDELRAGMSEMEAVPILRRLPPESN